MTTMRFLRAGSDPRGAPRPWLGRRPLALVLLAVAGLTQPGCRSSGCGSPCGPSLSSPCNWFSGLSQRMFRPRAAAPAAGCCGPETVSEAPITELQAAPAAIVPVPAPGVIQKSPPPAEEIITPNESKGSTGTQGASRTRPSAGRASYQEVSRPRERTGREFARTGDSNPEPTSGSAQGSASASDGLDNLPPLEIEIPRDLTATESGNRPASPPAAAADTSPASAPGGSAVPNAATNVPAPAPGNTNASPPASTSTNRTTPAAASATPGPRRFVSLEPKLAGGSLPDAAGLDWLREKGYKTFLDLRESAEVQPSFIADVTNRGMRYVALPVSVKTLDADHISRFQFELSLSDARPLYFCDADGSRAGALWYIRRMTVDKVDQQAATRDAEQLGLSDKAFWHAATAYVERLNPPKAVETAPAELSAQKIFEEAAKGEAPKPEPAPKAAAASTPAHAPGTASLEPKPAPTPSVRDTTAWRSFAALCFTGLVAPLAYMGFSALPTLRQPKRASLPAPARRPKSLPGA